MKVIKEMSKLLLSSLFEDVSKFDWFSLIATLILSVYVWTLDMSLETQYIPTILNGVATATSLFVGFTGTLVAISVPRATQHKWRISLEIIMLTFPMIALFNAYFDVVRGNFQGSIKWALTGLVLSFFIIQNFAQFLSDLWRK